MLKQQKLPESEEIVNLIERMIDLRFKIMIENQYGNYRGSISLTENHYNPTVQELIAKLEKIGVDLNSV
jgi:hypothetical protein